MGQSPSSLQEVGLTARLLRFRATHHTTSAHPSQDVPNHALGYSAHQFLHHSQNVPKWEHGTWPMESVNPSKSCTWLLRTSVHPSQSVTNHAHGYSCTWLRIGAPSTEAFKQCTCPMSSQICTENCLTGNSLTSWRHREKICKQATSRLTPSKNIAYR
jgi:hypothetical protein